MKKKIIPIVVGILVLATVFFAGCSKQKDLNELQDKLNRVSEATAIEQTIEIKNGNLIQYSSVTSYTKSGSNFQWTQTSKTLNQIDLNSSSAYKEETSSGTSSASSFVPTLKLNGDYFEKGFTADKTSLNATVVAGREKDVLGVGDLPSPTANLALTLTAQGDNVSELGISYGSDSLVVTITFTFNY